MQGSAEGLKKSESTMLGGTRGKGEEGGGKRVTERNRCASLCPTEKRTGH